jgi:hypothetical protein
MAQSLLGQFARPHARDRARVLIDMPNSIPLPDGAAYGELNIPTLVVGAPGDPCHPFTLAQTLSTWIPKARFVEVPRKDVDPREHTDALTRVRADPIRTVRCLPRTSPAFLDDVAVSEHDYSVPVLRHGQMSGDSRLAGVDAHSLSRDGSTGSFAADTAAARSDARRSSWTTSRSMVWSNLS